MNEVLKVVKREFYVNRKLSYSYLPIFLIMVLLFAVMGRVVESINRHLILLLAINLFFPMIYFVNVYLQELKDKDLQFLFSLPLEKNNVFAGKIMYIVLVVVGFNFVVYFISFPIFASTIVYLNSLLLNCFVGIMVGMSFLTFFLLSSFENYINFSQYLRIIIVLAFISVTYVLKFDLAELETVFVYNPIYPTLIYSIIIYLFYKTVVIRFKRKKSYL